MLNARIKGIIVVNAPKFVERAINSIFKPLLKKKIDQRVGTITHLLAVLYHRLILIFNSLKRIKT